MRRKYKKNKSLNRKSLAIIILVLLLTTFFIWYHFHNRKPSSTSQSAKSSAEASSSAAKNNTQPFNKHQYSINDPTSLWVVVNKGRQLPSSYAPSDLVVPDLPIRPSASGDEQYVRAQTAAALKQLFAAAAKDGLQFMIGSGYRSYSFQSSVYNNFVASQGRAQADRSSARPGHSEHQTGWAVDVEPASRQCEIELCFGNLAEGKWLAANSYKYGFIIRYPKGKESLTGYEYEPWHIRYVGSSLANQVHQSGQTLEQFFGLPTFSDYPVTSYQLKPGS